MYNITPFLETERLYLSPVDEDNINEYFVFLNNQKNDIYTEHAEFPRAKDDIIKYIHNKSQSDYSVFLGVYLKDKKAHIGNIELCNINFIHRTAEYKILIDNNYHRNGYAIEASKKLIEHAFDRLNLYKINLGVSEDNDSAISLYNKLGFKQEGILVGQLLKNKRRINVLNMCIFSESS